MDTETITARLLSSTGTDRGDDGHFVAFLDGPVFHVTIIVRIVQDVHILQVDCNGATIEYFVLNPAVPVF